MELILKVKIQIIVADSDCMKTVNEIMKAGKTGAVRSSRVRLLGLPVLAIALISFW